MMEVERVSSALQSLDINSKSPEATSRVSTSQSLTSLTSSPSSSSTGAGSSDDFVLHKLSRINGAINKMTKEEIQEQLKSLGMNTGGVKEILKKRLKNFHKRQKLSQSKRLQQEDEQTPFDCLVVIDYEATCERNNDNFVHEIIEFPAVLIDVRTCTVTNVFQKFCKPKVNPRLTEFCKDLTGITQAEVDKAKDFKDVFQEFLEWMKSQGLGKERKFAIVTDGPWDMARFLKTQIDLSGLKFPQWARHWINLRKSYSSFYNVRRISLHNMLDELGLVFQGRPHCGLDDARNIAAIALCLLKDGCVFKNNEHLHEHTKQNHTLQTTQTTPKSQPRRKGRFPPGEVVEQEGENLDDLFLFAKLQSS